jgi:CRISPR-associated exonuclease Cas4
MAFTEDQLLPLSALQHYLFCPRQCALIHVEQVWAENQFTAEGKVLHERAHEGPEESRTDVRTTRGMPVRSLSLGVSGQCDVVEFHRDGSVFPVEYKRGRPKKNDSDRVQLCAQALCLEEMLAKEIDEGALYYGKNRRRHAVIFDAALRDLTRTTGRDLHAMVNAGRTPGAVREKKCDTCSLLEHCMPDALRFRQGVRAWFDRQLAADLRD